MNLTPKLHTIKMKIEQIARDYGLDFYETIFEMIDYDEMNAIAAYGGFPTRYPHWSYGMEYDHLSKGYEYGLQKIYEMVINNNPCYAYLMKSNSLVDQKLVMAHVYAHNDFFKNNATFSKTNRKMMDEIANHGNRIRRYMDKYGVEQVEAFVDSCLSIQHLIDHHAPFIVRRVDHDKYQCEDEDITIVKKFKREQKGYIENFIKPAIDIKQAQELIEEEKEEKIPRIPIDPEKDILLFLINYSPLPEWKRDILHIIREEAYYFSPQGQTKIMNEGWATYWHSKMMTEKIINDSEVIDFADHHSGTVASSPGRINPYKVGLELFRHIEERWDKGRFGLEYEMCDDYNKKKSWDTGAMLGREKIFQVRKIYNDSTFIDEFLTQEFCDEQKLFTYGVDRRTGRYVILDKDHRKVKQRLLFSLTNFGQPIIYVLDGNYKNRGELYLIHKFEGVGLDINHAKATMENIQKIWGRPVHLESVINEKPGFLTFDGKEHTTTEITEDNQKFLYPA